MIHRLPLENPCSKSTTKFETQVYFFLNSIRGRQLWNLQNIFLIRTITQKFCFCFLLCFALLCFLVILVTNFHSGYTANICNFYSVNTTSSYIFILVIPQTFSFFILYDTTNVYNSHSIDTAKLHNFQL